MVVTDAADAAGADGLVSEVVKQAFQDAADPKAFPEQMSVLGLEPWKAGKLYGRCDGNADGPVVFDLTAVSAPLEATLREFAEIAAAGLGDEAPAIPAKRSFRLIAANMPGAEDHHDLMQGVELAHGGFARRQSAEGEPSPETIQAIRRRAELRAIAETPIGGLTDPERLLSQVGPMTADMPDEQAGRAVFAVARHFAQSGQWDLARETFLMMVQRYPAHPRTPDALRWLIQHNCSGEARRRSELGQFVAAGQVQFGLPKSEPAVMPPADAGDDKKDKKTPENASSLKRPKASGSATSPGPRRCANGSRAAWTWSRCWRVSARCSRTIRRCSSRFRRRAATSANSTRPISGTPISQPASPMARGARRGCGVVVVPALGAPPKAVAYCRLTDERPYLDGKLDDACWQAAAPMPLRDAVGGSAGDFKTEARMANDHDFLYVAVRCTHPADRREAAGCKPRTHDADLSGHDRVSILLDVDRDYATCFHFEVDQRGCVADDCWGDRTWDPRWFVAVHKEDTEWVVEAAIPLAALTGDGVTPGRAWCCNVIRTVPGRGVQAWSLPAEAPEAVVRPEGMGLLIFTQDGKARRRTVGAAAP